MIPGHPSHSAMGAFHPTPIASSRTSDQPTTRRRRRRRAGTRRATSSPDDDEDIPRAQHAAVGTQGNYVNPHADSDEPHPRHTHAGACPTVAPPRPAPRQRLQAARETGCPVGSKRPLHRRATAKMSPRIRTGPEPVLAAHVPLPPAAAATARRKPDQVPITEQNFFGIAYVAVSQKSRSHSVYSH